MFTNSLQDDQAQETLQEMRDAQSLHDNARLLELNVENIVAAVAACQDYTKRVISGEIEGDHRVSKLLDAALTSISQLSASSVETLLREHYQDLLFVQHICTLTHNQISLFNKFQQDQV